MSLVVKASRRIFNDGKLLLGYYRRAESITNFSLTKLYDEVTSYIKKRNVQGVAFSFSDSCKAETLYSSCYACLTLGLLNHLDLYDKEEWIRYFNSFQANNGLFYDPITIKKSEYNEGDGWGARHLLVHLLIAYERLGSIPLKPLLFLKEYATPDKMISWLNSLNMKNIYLTSNKIMNIICSMQYARDRMNEPYNDSINAAEEWLRSRFNSNFGLWIDGETKKKKDINDAVRGSYHLFPIFSYDHIKIDNTQNTVQTILRTQNMIGGFDTCFASSACFDIDAIDPLVRFGLDDKQVIYALQKAFKWVMANKNDDGGFVFQRNASFAYGGESTLSSKANESNIFATWFRLLSIVFILEKLKIQHKSKLLNAPGYEMRTE